MCAMTKLAHQIRHRQRRQAGAHGAPNVVNDERLSAPPNSAAIALSSRALPFENPLTGFSAEVVENRESPALKRGSDVQNFDYIVGERHDMRRVGLHPFGRDGPQLGEQDRTPASVASATSLLRCPVRASIRNSGPYG